MAYSYACKDYPGMDSCPGFVRAETEAEVMTLVETHARLAHGEEPAAWGDEDRATVKALIRPD